MAATPDFELFMGPFLILVCVALMYVRFPSMLRTFAEPYASLFGVTCAQVYSYWTTYEHDPLGYKILVTALWCVEQIRRALRC